jgi:hypothetical protein
MAKARKRGSAPLAKKDKGRGMQLMIIVIVVLLVSGWVLGGIIGFSPGGPAQEWEEPEPEYGVGTSVGPMMGRVESVSGYRAVFGQLDVPLNLAERLGGYLYVLDGGVSYLIVTGAEGSKIRDAASGSYIVYDIASCGSFDCLLKEGSMPNGSLAYDAYELDSESAFLKTTRVGFPAY